MTTLFKPQEWFEMKLLRKRSTDSAAWIPLHAIEHVEASGSWANLGYCQETFACGTVAVPVEHREAIKKVGWSDLGVSRRYRGRVQDEVYIPADEFHPWNLEGVIGTYLILIQERVGKNEGEWLIHPDLLLTLGLYREGDTWVCPEEGYVEVIKLHRQADGKKSKIEIRADFLKDYLSARGWGLWMTWYRERNEIQEDVSYLTWPGLKAAEDTENMRWGARVTEIHEGNGNPYGSQAAVFHVTRTNVDFEEDVPKIGLPSVEESFTSTSVRSFEGRKLYHVLGELWREEWVAPAPASPRVKEDEPASKPTFIIDAAGTREDATTLSSGGRWLWFKPEVVKQLLSYRDGQLSWYTAKTGEVGADGAGSVTFGVNDLGLINVYAKDIGYLPYWQQQIWAGFNVNPDGKVCSELLHSQAVGMPVDTQAPEDYLGVELERLNHSIQEEFGITAFKPHRDTEKIIAKCHRFRATTLDGLLELAKDLARITADSLDSAEMLKKLSPPKGEKWGGLKCLQNLVALKIKPDLARRMAAPLFGTYDLRLADAHLAKSELKQAMENAGVDETKPPIIQGEMMLVHFVSALAAMSTVIRRRPAGTSV